MESKDLPLRLTFNHCLNTRSVFWDKHKLGWLSFKSDSSFEVTVWGKVAQNPSVSTFHEHLCPLSMQVRWQSDVPFTASFTEHCDIAQITPLASAAAKRTADCTSNLVGTSLTKCQSLFLLWAEFHQHRHVKRSPWVHGGQQKFD